ncbi:hypothetical protein [Sphingobium sp. DN12]|uniref:hypothetical protein n=1 Tax=Sphingobium sp. DN12 TaxID=3378073 RepID=UPI003DA213B6
MLISMMSLTVAQSMGGDGRRMTMWPDDVGSTIGRDDPGLMLVTTVGGEDGVPEDTDQSASAG